MENFILQDFDSKIKNEDISVVQFSAAWCGPCKVLKPVMDKLSDEYKDKAGFYYADVEDGGINTGSAAGIRGVPTVIIYKKGVDSPSFRRRCISVLTLTTMVYCATKSGANQQEEGSRIIQIMTLMSGLW